MSKKKKEKTVALFLRHGVAQADRIANGVRVVQLKGLPPYELSETDAAFVRKTAPGLFLDEKEKAEEEAKLKKASVKEG